MTNDNKNIHLFIKIEPTMEEFTVSTPEDLPDASDFMKYILDRVVVKTADVVKPFSIGKLKQLSGVVIPHYSCYVVTGQDLREKVVVHSFVDFGHITVHPVTKELIIVAEYTPATEVVCPIDVAIDSVLVDFQNDGKDIVINFNSGDTVISHKLPPGGDLLGRNEISLSEIVEHMEVKT